jgi:hypothetical protein
MKSLTQISSPFLPALCRDLAGRARRGAGVLVRQGVL